MVILLVVVVVVVDVVSDPGLAHVSLPGKKEDKFINNIINIFDIG